jgi:hypothetical protein
MHDKILSIRRAAASVVLLAGVASVHGEVRRCEDAAGRVTYSNESCPQGTAHERPIEERPAVQVPRDAAGEKAQRSGKMTMTVPAPDAGRAAERAEEIAREQRKSAVARCDDLVRRVEYAQQDLLTASGGERASVELGLHRLQEEYEATCAAPAAPGGPQTPPPAGN